MSDKKKETVAVPVTDRPKEVTTLTGETVSTKPDDLGDYKGKYKHTATGEVYGLKVAEDDPHGRTHKAKSNDHYWEGTEEEFKQQFEK